MDADILRKQLRKSLVSTRRFQAADLDESLSDDDSHAGSPPSKKTSREDEENLTVPDLVKMADTISEVEEDFGQESDHEEGEEGSEYHSTHDLGSENSGEEENEQEEEGDEEEEEEGDEEEDNFDSFKLAVRSEENEFENEEEVEGEGVGVNHMSVLEAWSKQIQNTAAQIRSRDDEFGGSSGLKVEYSEGQARSPMSPIANLDSSIDEEAYEFGAECREDLENLGKIFIRVKIEACMWIEQVLNDNSMFLDEIDGEKKDPKDTATLFEVLKSGVILCRLANELVPGCIKSFKEDLSGESAFVVPLSEKENISKFIRACKDAMSIPPSLLFSEGDLHNMQNMPKVILSLRAVSEYARIYLNSEPRLHWPHFKGIDAIASEDEDSLLLAQSEMSKLDAKTVHHMYEVEQSPSKYHKQQRADIEKAGFQERKQSIQRSLVMSNVGKSSRKETPIRTKMKSQSPFSPQTAESLSSPLSHTVNTFQNAARSPVSYDMASVEPISAHTDDRGELASMSVLEWLDRQGLASYHSAFLHDGWDELGTVSLMTDDDLDEIGLTKKGHRRRITNALRKLRLEFPLSPHGKPGELGLSEMVDDAFQSSRNSLGAGSTSGASHAMSPTRRYSIEKREIMNKDNSWLQCREKANFTLDLDDAKAIWSMFNELKTETKTEGFLRQCAPEVTRSIGYLVSATEDLVSSLLPYDSPIILDIGWNSIKCGFAFSSRPIEVPSIVGKSNTSSVRSSFRSSKPFLSTGQQPESNQGDLSTRKSLNHSFTAGRNVYEKCQNALNASALSSASDVGALSVRHMLHRGIDSIKDPVLIEWEDLERILQHIYRDILHTFSDSHPVMIVEPTKAWTSYERSRLAEMMFEKFQCPALYFSPAAPMVAFQIEEKNCVVLDLGESRSSATVVYNYRVVKDSVIHSPIAGLQLTELMMQSLTQDGYEFKSIFEAKNPNQFSPLRHFMEHEIAEELKEQVCQVSDEFDEKCVYSEALPPFLVDYLPRVTRGNKYINIGEARVRVPEALFCPEVIRRDQFYNGGSLQHIVKEALQHCTDVVGNASAEKVILFGGIANMPGLETRLQSELDELYSSEPRKTPRVVLLNERDTGDSTPRSVLINQASPTPAGVLPCNPSHIAWLGAAKLVTKLDFQSRWIHRQTYKEKGEKVLRDSTVTDALGPFPLYSPDTVLYKANRTVNALSEVITTLQHLSESGDEPSFTATSKGKQMSSTNPSTEMRGIQSRVSTPGHSQSKPLTKSEGVNGKPLVSRYSPPNTPTGTELSTHPLEKNTRRENPLSPNSYKDLIGEVTEYLEQRGCPEDITMNVKYHLYNNQLEHKMTVDEIIRSLPDELLGKFAGKIHDGTLKPLKKGHTVDSLNPRATLYSDDEEDEDEDSVVFAMAI